MENFLKPNDPTIREAVESIIDKSDGLITALESVCAMYNIPSSHILCDDGRRGIRVDNDTIIAPDLQNPGRFKEHIMRSVGAVLDHVSNRIDAKLDQYHRNCADEGTSQLQKIENAGAGTETPSEEFPMQSYFGDQDDLTAGLDITPTPTESSLVENTTDVSEAIGESATFVDLYDELGGSTSMGYALLKSQGFDYVQPTSTFVQEAANSGKELSPSELKYLRFDTTNLVEAVKCFNKAREEQDVKSLDNLSFKNLMGSSTFQKGIDYLNKQFDARINIRFFHEKFGPDVYTIPFDDFKQKMTISKAKGFQLNKLNIEIHIVGHMLTELMKKNSKMFGQSFVAICLHEIFHNIYKVLYSSEIEMISTMSLTMGLATSINSAKERKAFFLKYVSSLEKFGGVKLRPLSRRMLAKKLTMISIAKDEETLKKLQNQLNSCGDSDEELKRIIRWYERQLAGRIKNTKRAKKISKIVALVSGAIGVIGGVMFGIGNAKDSGEDGGSGESILTKIGAFVCGAGILAFLGSGVAWSNAKIQDMVDDYAMDNPRKEEFYCDLFAAMYKLPGTFFPTFGFSDKRITANEGSPDLIRKLAQVQMEYDRNMMTKYPTDMERNHLAVTAARKILATDKQLDPAIKEYLNWVVDHYSSVVDDTDIKTNYNAGTFDPEAAEDLDGMIQTFIDKANDEAIRITK